MIKQKVALIKPQACTSDAVVAYDAEWWQPDYWLTDYQQCVLLISLAGATAGIAGAYTTMGTGAYVAAQAGAAAMAWLTGC